MKIIIIFYLNYGMGFLTNNVNRNEDALAIDGTGTVVVAPLKLR